ncbi:unnamed protein product [Dibothriocephalus latus]|uniref:Tyrosine-protein phosphatase domain-containing protein n=1 Tax=Dibothriocephalus latus TaxID=60516 RepID=A0A3P6TUJ5_DIBLA|nr:unnamed protein product [Dibothriocephalus latus]
MDCSPAVANSNYAFKLLTALPCPQANLYADVYVDASYVNRCEYHRTDSFAIVPDFGTVPDFIAATTPMKSTCPQFLTMIAQQCCPLIIHLDGLAETEKFPQNQYWPKEFNEETFTDGVRACNVFAAEVSNHTHWIDRMLEITPSDSGHSWTAEQMQISAWSSRRNPRPDILYDFIMTFLDKMAVHAVNERFGPPIIHASSTDGRVGTFICAVSLLQQLQTNSNYIDVFGTVLSLRKQRSNLVNNKKQLEYLYRFMKYCIAMAITVECEMPSLPVDQAIERTRTVQHRINTGNAAPKHIPSQRIPFHFLEELHNLVENVPHQGMIKPYTSPVQLRCLNAVTVRDSFSLSRPDDLLDSMEGKELFTTLDLSFKLKYIRRSRQDCHYTAIGTIKVKQVTIEFG